MKLLVSAFACAPNTGSEPGVGWRWAIELAKEHEVTVITDVTRRSLIEPMLQAAPVPNLHIEYFRPFWLRRVPLNSWTAQLLYGNWQFGLLSFARRLHRREHFDAALHVTYGVFRHPSFLGLLGIPLIFGPVGGGEDAPWRLKRSIRGREKIKELLRSLVNRVALFDPFLWLGLASARSILVKTEETRRALPWPFRRRALVYPEIGIDISDAVTAVPRQPDQPLRVLFVGRLLGWKGAHLAIRAVAAARGKGISIDFTLVGKGPYEPELRRLSRELGAAGEVQWVPQIPQKDLFALYRSMHCFLFPSLHDSSGNVVLEAQANGLPVICLDIGGPATLVTDETAFVVATRGNEDTVVKGLADALEKLGQNDSLRTSMAASAVRHAGTYSWSSRALGALEGIEQRVRSDAPSGVLKFEERP